MASLQTGVAGDPAGEVPTHATRRPQTYRLVAGPILGSFTFRVTACIGRRQRRRSGRCGRVAGRAAMVQ